jgi:hypothetical protein
MEEVEILGLNNQKERALSEADLRGQGVGGGDKARTIRSSV